MDIKKIMSEMTLEDKASLCSGWDFYLAVQVQNPFNHEIASCNYTALPCKKSTKNSYSFVSKSYSQIAFVYIN